MPNKEKRSRSAVLAEQFAASTASVSKRSRPDDKPEKTEAAKAVGNVDRNKASSSDYFNKRIAEIQAKYAKYNLKQDAPDASPELPAPGLVSNPKLSSLPLKSRGSGGSEAAVVDAHERQKSAVVAVAGPRDDFAKNMSAAKSVPQEIGSFVVGNCSASPLQLSSFMSQLITPNAVAVGGDNAGTVAPENVRRHRIICVQNLPPDCADVDLIKEFQWNHDFGNVSYVSVAAQSSKAFVEFENGFAAEKCLNFARDKKNAIAVRGTAVKITITNKLALPREGIYESADATNVLWMQIFNLPCDKPIEVVDIYGVCEERGLLPLVRIAIELYPSSVKAFIEFKSIAEATRAKFALNGHDIFPALASPNRCTMRVEFACMDEVEVNENDANQWDFDKAPLPSSHQKKIIPDSGQKMDLADDAAVTTPKWIPIGAKPWSTEASVQKEPCASNLYGTELACNSFSAIGSAGHNDARSDTSLTSPALPSPIDVYGGVNDLSSPPSPNISSCGASAYDPFAYMRTYSASGYYPMPPTPVEPAAPANFGLCGWYPMLPTPVEPPAPAGFGLGGSYAVLLICGVNYKKMNCDRLFNLLSLYGNVCKIIFLKARHPSDLCVGVMVQMGDATAAQRTREYLDGVSIFGWRITIKPTDQSFVRSPSGFTRTLPDGTSSFKDYTSSSLNRFCGPGATKNRITSPRATLHFSYSWNDLTESKLRQVFQQLEIASPVEVTMSNATSSASSGRLRFSTVSDAVEAVILGNGITLEAPRSRSSPRLPRPPPAAPLSQQLLHVNEAWNVSMAKLNDGSGSLVHENNLAFSCGVSENTPSECSNHSSVGGESNHENVTKTGGMDQCEKPSASESDRHHEKSAKIGGVTIKQELPGEDE